MEWMDESMNKHFIRNFELLNFCEFYIKNFMEGSGSHSFGLTV